MIEINFSPSFVRVYKKLPEGLKEEIKLKFEEFKDKGNHKKLKVHKLHGELKNYYSFSVDYKNRIVFEWLSSKSVVLHMIGDHSVYQ